MLHLFYGILLHNLFLVITVGTLLFIYKFLSRSDYVMSIIATRHYFRLPHDIIENNAVVFYFNVT